jgi:hypothetical protein
MRSVVIAGESRERGDRVRGWRRVAAGAPRDVQRWGAMPTDRDPTSADPTPTPPHPDAQPEPRDASDEGTDELLGEESDYVIIGGEPP